MSMPRTRAHGLTAVAVSVLTLAAGAARAESPELPDPNFRALRYTDDPKPYADPAGNADVYGKLKYYRMGNTEWGPIFLSLGGEIRERSETYSHQSFGFKAPPTDSYVLERLQLDANLHFTDHFRFFAQFSDNDRFGNRGVSSTTDTDRGDITQVFADIRIPTSLGDAPTLRAGREELLFGFQRLIAVREGPNDRRDFDGFRFSDNWGGVSVDLIDVRPVNDPGSTMSDYTNYAQRLVGGYLTAPIPGVTDLDVYLLDYTNTSAKYRGLTGVEHRDTLGARLFGKSHGFDWNFEAASQTGTFGNLQISAYMLAGIAGYTFENVPLTPRLGFSANYASGDNAHNATTIGTFDAMYPRLPYFAETSQLVPANVKDIRAVLSFAPAKNVEVVLGWDNLWRVSATDGLYGSGMVEYANSSTVSGMKVGTETTIDTRWQVDSHLSFGAIAAYFAAGPAITQTRPAAGQPYGNSENFYVLYAKYKF